MCALWSTLSWSRIYCPSIESIKLLISSSREMDKFNICYLLFDSICRSQARIICIALSAENIIGFYKVSTASVLDWIAVSWSCLLRAFVLQLLYDRRWTWTRRLSGPRESLVTSCSYAGNRIWTPTVESLLVGPSSSSFYRLSLTLCSLFDLPLGFRFCFLQNQGWWWTRKGQ